MASPGDHRISDINSTPELEEGLHYEPYEHQTSTGNRKRRGPLHKLMYQAALRGDWQAAENLLQEDSDLSCAEITERDETALHVAARNKQTTFVRKLVKRMRKEDLLLLDGNLCTAFSYAALSGIVENAAVMLEKNKDLADYGDLPLLMAVALGHTDMVSYLYPLLGVERSIDQKSLFEIFCFTIHQKMYDVALKIFTSNNEALATMKTEKGSTALSLLARQDISDIITCQEALLESLIRMIAVVPFLSWLKRICEQPLIRRKDGRLLAQKVWDVTQKLELLQQDEYDQLTNDALHDAVKVGNVGFITMLTRSDPDLVFKCNSNGRTIFHSAVVYRQENVFSLIHQMGVMKDLFLVKDDEKGNNILQLAGELPPDQNILKIVAGPALQMQRELMWFKEVKKITPFSIQEMEIGPISHQDKEKEEVLTPAHWFSKNHEPLLKEGERWLKETTNSCMITATLTATVVFAAAFTVPGGINGNTGTPILLERSWFTVFVVSDAAAMFFSIFSIIMFLSILTSRFQEDDFLVSLPKKLILGLTSLFASIVGTIFAFTSTCFLLFTDQSTVLPTSIAVVSCFSLIIAFIRMHFKLWYDTFRATYIARSLFASSKHKLY